MPNEAFDRLGRNTFLCLLGGALVAVINVLARL